MAAVNPKRKPTNKKMRYQQLTDFLLTKLPKRYHGKFYSWMENGKLINLGRQVTVDGIEICRLDYDGILFFDEFPFAEISPAKVMAWIQVWLNENDDMRDRLDAHEIPFDLDIIDDQTADLSFTIAFSEPLTAQEDENGDIHIGGQPYRLDEIDIFTAEQIDVDVGIAAERAA